MAERYSPTTQYRYTEQKEREKQSREEDREKLGIRPGEVEGKAMFQGVARVEELDSYKHREKENESIYSGSIPGKKLRKTRKRYVMGRLSFRSCN